MTESASSETVLPPPVSAITASRYVALPAMSLLVLALSFAALLWGLAAIESPGRQMRADDDTSRRELHLESRAKALLADSIAPRDLSVSVILEAHTNRDSSVHVLVRVKETTLQDQNSDQLYQTLWKGLALNAERGDSLEVIAAPFNRQLVRLIPALLAQLVGIVGFLGAAAVLVRWGFLSHRPRKGTADFTQQLQQVRGIASEQPARLAAVLRHWLSAEAGSEARQMDIDPLIAEEASQLLLALPEADAANVIKRLPPGLVQPLAARMVDTATPGSAELRSILARVVDDLEVFGDVASGDNIDIFKLLSSAIGPEQAKLVHQSLAIKSPLPNIQRLKWLGASAVVDIIAEEHPQVQTVVIAALPAEQASAVVLGLDEERRVDVLARLADLQSLSTAAFEELDALIGEQLKNTNRPVKQPVEGQQLAANLLNRLDSADEAALLQGLRSRHPDSAGQVENHLFGFDQLAQLTRSDLRSILVSVNNETVATALSGATTAVSSRILDALLVERRPAVRVMLSKNKPRASDLQLAREELVLVARRMAESGEIALDSRSVESF